VEESQEEVWRKGLSGPMHENLKTVVKMKNMGIFTMKAAKARGEHDL
jgi:hypothetical protein